MILVRSVSCGSSASTEVFRIWRMGFRYDMLTYCSADNASVKSWSGLRALFMDSRTSRSCHEGSRCRALRSVERTLVKACCCSRILDIIFCVDPHRVWQSVNMACSGRLSSLCASLKASFFFQLWEKWPTSFLHVPIALLVR